MKNSLIFRAAFMIMMVTFSINTIAQTSNEKAIPQTIITAFNAKYPGAPVKSWKVDHDRYIAKAIIDNHKSFATFNNNASWLSTTTKMAWPWKLPKAIKEAYRKTKYHSWHIYSVMKVEKGTGESFVLMIDNGNLQIDATHQSVLTNDKLLEFATDGALKQTIDLSGDPADYATVGY
jgi:Putative beta-lactamase-inhibitor-like, PepSY-like